MTVSRIVSGGQTGADRAGLDAAIYCGVPHGGWCPAGRKAEDGRIPDKYHLRETETADYLTRTEANVVDSDATVVFTYGPATGGSLRTIEFARKHGRPYLHVDLKASRRPAAAVEIAAWLRNEGGTDCEDYEAAVPSPRVLNVAGSRASKLPHGAADLVMAILVDVLIATNPECRSHYPLGDVDL